jgi:hypothetical protein
MLSCMHTAHTCQCKLHCRVAELANAICSAFARAEMKERKVGHVADQRPSGYADERQALCKLGKLFARQCIQPLKHVRALWLEADGRPCSMIGIARWQRRRSFYCQCQRVGARNNERMIFAEARRSKGICKRTELRRSGTQNVLSGNLCSAKLHTQPRCFRLAAWLQVATKRAAGV